MSRLEGRTLVIEIHPPLPMATTDRAGGETWQAVMGSLLEDYVRRFPEQSLGPAFSWIAR
jgi:hypothetical protein